MLIVLINSLINKSSNIFRELRTSLHLILETIQETDTIVLPTRELIQFLPSRDSNSHFGGEWHVGLHNSHMWSKRKGPKDARVEQERETYHSEEIMNLCVICCQYTPEWIDSLSLQGLPSLYVSFMMWFNPFCTAQVFRRGPCFIPRCCEQAQTEKQPPPPPSSGINKASQIWHSLL